MLAFPHLDAGVFCTFSSRRGNYSTARIFKGLAKINHPALINNIPRDLLQQPVRYILTAF